MDGHDPVRSLKKTSLILICNINNKDLTCVADPVLLTFLIFRKIWNKKTMGTSKFSKLSDKEFMNLIKNAPLVSIDLIVKNKKDEVLLGLRKNAPAKGTWFVPGGRIGKNETLQEAFKRIANN